MVKLILSFIFFLSAMADAFAQKIATIPFEQLYGGVILVKAKLSTRPDTLNFILDTGSSHISLDSTATTLLNLPVTQTDNYVNGIGGKHKVKKTSGLDLMFPNLTVKNLNFYVNDYSVITESSGVRIDGIIGFAFFSKYILAVNFDSSRIDVYNPAPFKYPRKGYLWKFNLDYIPNTELQVTDARSTYANYYIDCGAGLSLLFAENFVNDSLFLKKNKKIFSSQIEGVGGKSVTKIAVVKLLKLGPYRFRNVPAYIYNDVADVLRYPEHSGLIGNDILRRFNWIMNYGRSEMHLQPNSFAFDSFDYSYTGLSIYLVNNNIQITDIIPNSPGELAKFKVGDVLLSIDNTIITSVKQAKDLMQNFTKVLKIIVIRDGVLTPINLKVRSIL